MTSLISEPQAWSLYEAKRYAESARVWEGLLQSTPSDCNERSRLLNGYVYALVGLKRFDEARKIHRDLFEKHRNHIDLHQLAFVEREAGDYHLALKYIHDERLLIAPDAWSYLGANSYERGKLSELLGELDRALGFAKQCEEESKRSSDLVLQACSMRLLGDIYAKLERPGTALSQYECAENLFKEAGETFGAEEIKQTIERLRAIARGV